MRRVLIVDDDPDIRELLRAILGWDGYVVETANDGMAALETLAGSDEAWIVLLDINMPRMNGLEVCAHLTALGVPAVRCLVVLMTAGFFPDGDMPPSVRALLPKPFDLNALHGLMAALDTVDSGGGDEPRSLAVSPTRHPLDLWERQVA